MRRSLWATPIFAAACLSGCLPYGYPTVACIPPIHSGCDLGQVHAFRVDITSYHGDMGGGPEKVVLTPLALSADGTWPQPRLSLDHGFAVWTPALSYRTLHRHSVAVRLYRPGYELVEINEGDPIDSVCWKTAPDAAREKALDDLFGSGLAPGSASREQRQALLFGAAEYDRLAPGENTRPAAKAEKLRMLAEQ